MPPEAVPSNASVASTGLGLRYIGNHCYAYSGSITDEASSAADTTILKFTTGSGYIIAKLTITNDEASTAALFIEAFLNGQKVMDIITDLSSINNPLITPYEMLIPPFTEFELKAGANSTVDFTAFIAGRVYD